MTLTAAQALRAIASRALAQPEPPAPKPPASSRWRWIDREGNETEELRQLRVLRRLGQTPSQLAEAFGLKPSSLKALFKRYEIRSPRSVQQEEQRPQGYRATTPLDAAQPPEPPAPTLEQLDEQQLEAATTAWLDHQQEKDHYRQTALAQREETTDAD